MPDGDSRALLRLKKCFFGWSTLACSTGWWLLIVDVVDQMDVA